MPVANNKILGDLVFTELTNEVAYFGGMERINRARCGGREVWGVCDSVNHGIPTSAILFASVSPVKTGLTDPAVGNKD